MRTRKTARSPVSGSGSLSGDGPRDQIFSDAWGEVAKKHPVFSPAEERQIFRRYAKSFGVKREELKWKIIFHNIGLVFSTAQHFRGRGLEFEDLVQEGVFGLRRAVEKFDLKKKTRFSTYATWWIRQAIASALSEKGNIIRIPGAAFEQRVKLKKKALKDGANQGEIADLSEVAVRSGLCSSARLRLTSGVFKKPLSLDVSTTNDKKDSDFFAESGWAVSNDLSPSERVMALEELKILRDRLAYFLGVVEIVPVTDRDKDIFKLYALQSKDGSNTLESVGASYGITRERIRQISTRVWLEVEKRTSIGNTKSYYDLVERIEDLETLLGEDPVQVVPEKLVPEQVVRGEIRLSGGGKPPQIVNEILETIASVCNISIEEIKGGSRKRQIAFRRRVIIYILCEDLGMVCADVAKVLECSYKLVNGNYANTKKILAKNLDLQRGIERARSSCQAVFEKHGIPRV